MIPEILSLMKKYLEESIYDLHTENRDGRINSSISEDIIIEILQKQFRENIEVPKHRCWYDILVKDVCLEIPVNIKITTTKTADNIGNLAPCVYAYTNHNMRLRKNYNNGQLSEILVKKIKNKEYNTIITRDYWFFVVNKNTKEIIVNSVLGLSKLTPNINNLPFQIKWKDNLEYNYNGKIEEKINLLVNTLKKPKPSWKEIFMNKIREL